MEDESSDEEDKPKKKTPKKTSSKGAADSSSEDSDFEDVTKSKERKASAAKKKSRKEQKKSGKEEISSEDKKKLKSEGMLTKELKIKIKKLKQGSESSNYDSDLENDLTGLETLPKEKIKKKSKNEVRTKDQQTESSEKNKSE